MSNDKPKVPDENDRLKAGKLSANAFDGTKPVEPLYVVDSKMRKIGEPSDVAAERALLAALLWAAANAPDSLRASQVVDILPDGGPFLVREHGFIYDAMLDCLVKDDATGRKPVEHDAVAVAQHAATMGHGSDKTGAEALQKLQAAASTVSEVQVRAYAESIKAMWVKREAIRELRTIVSDALSPTVNDIAIFERAQKAALQIMERSSAKASTVSVKQSAEQLFIDLDAKGGKAMSTGLPDLDALLNGGLRAPETSIVAARTSVGKSTISIGIGEHVCVSEPLAGVLYVSMEMPHKSFTAKLLAARTPGVTVKAIRKKVLNETQWSQLASALESVKDLELHFTVSMNQTLTSVFSAASERQRVLKKAGKRLALVIIDHVGLVKPSAEVLKRATRQQQVAETSRGMRWIATELGCHVMGLAQIHRDAERQKPSESVPKLHHLRESGDLEQDADQIMILHRPRDPGTGLFLPDKLPALIVAKSRMDETGGLLLGFENGRYVPWTDPTRTFLTEYEKRDDEAPATGQRAKPPARVGGASSDPPPNFFDGHGEGEPRPAKPKVANDVLERTVGLAVEAVTPGIDIMRLYRKLGEDSGVEFERADAAIAVAIERGLLRVEGAGTDRKLWRSSSPAPAPLGSLRQTDLLPTSRDGVGADVVGADPPLSDGPAIKTKAKRKSRRVDPDAVGLEVLPYVLSAITPDITVAALRQKLDQGKGMLASTVDEGVRVAIAKRLVVVDGFGDAATIRRIT